MFYQLVGIANASFYDSQTRSNNQSSLEPIYDKTQVDIRLFNILYWPPKEKRPPGMVPKPAFCSILHESNVFAVFLARWVAGAVGKPANS